MAVPTTSRPPLRAGALEKYAGKWVAIRDGDVVAAADTFDELVNKKRVKPGDAFYHVPPAETLYY